MTPTDMFQAEYGRIASWCLSSPPTLNVRARLLLNGAKSYEAPIRGGHPRTVWGIHVYTRDRKPFPIPLQPHPNPAGFFVGGRLHMCIFLLTS